MKYQEHHAYLMVGPAELIISELEADLSGTELIREAWPSFGIEQSRNLREKQARVVAEGETRSFILEFSSITVEAQQALLKTLEEPALRTYFFLVAPTVQMFLPTLLSRLRVRVLAADQSVLPEVRRRAAEFLAADPEARLSRVQDLTGGEEAPAVLRAAALEFVNALILVLHEQFKDLADTSMSKAFLDLERTRDYLQDRASSPRLLLEHLALVLPRL